MIKAILVSAKLKENCQYQNVLLETPLRKNMTDKRSKSDVKLMMKLRRRIETVIGQLSHYFDIERINYRDLWHLTSRIYQKLLSYSLGMKLNIQSGKAGWFLKILLSHKLTHRVCHR